MKRQYPEQRLQIAVRDLLNLAYPSLLWWAVPNGGSRDKREAAILKATGVKPGVPDLAFVLPGGQAAFIELKSETGTLTPEQKAMREALEARGAGFAVCRSLEAVQHALASWGVPTRITA